ncbi:hypothetical protein [Sphingomonas koreensis]
MAILTGTGKPMADLTLLRPIATAPRSGETVIGAWVSKTGKLMHEEPVSWSNVMVCDDDDCPVNITEWQGWSSGGDAFVLPSHWRCR